MAQPRPPRPHAGAASAGATGDARAPGWKARVALAAVLIGSAAIRLRLLAMPLERDEGEFAYMGQLILRGELPYVAAYNMKLPGVYYAYALIELLFGESEAAMRGALVLVSLLSTFLVYRLGCRLFDATAGVTAAAAFAMLSLGDAVLGLALKAEHFVVLCVLGGLLLLVGERRRIAAAGLLFGVAVLMKQHAAVFVAGGGWLVLAGGARRDRAAWRRAAREAGVFGAAALLPFALTCLGMYLAGAFEPFWFWTVRYAREYVGVVTPESGLALLRAQVGRLLATAPLLWGLAGLGLTTPWWDAPARRALPVLAPFVACSLLAVVPGLRFSEHYFLMLLPAASLLAGAAVSALAARAARRSAGRAAALRVGLPAAAVGLALGLQGETLLLRTPVEATRAIYGVNPFPEAVEIARWLRAHAAPGDRIAVIGSEPQIYFYAQRPAATAYIYMYPLMEPHPFARAMQEDMIGQIERAQPRFVVMVNVDTSWLRLRQSHDLLFTWAERLVNDGYRPVGLAEIVAGRPTQYRWGIDAGAAMPQSPHYVLTFERRP